MKWMQVLSPLFSKRRKKATEPIAPAFTPGARMYCIGDIHGRADLLQELHHIILADCEGYQGARKVIYLGDYVDRGESSKQVIDMLLSDSLPGFEPVFLRGNHEQAMMDFIKYPVSAVNWLQFGGLATLLSYRVGIQRPPLSRRVDEEELQEIADRLRQSLPEAHLAFLEATQLSHQEGSYFFAHAGIRPGTALEDQHPDDLLWIRRAFIDHQDPHPRIVVHGHTPVDEAELLPNRIGIDTGAYYSGVLTCLVLEGDQQRLLQTGTQAD
jgi:serine/threonine protein phosphatase 1